MDWLEEAHMKEVNNIFCERETASKRGAVQVKIKEIREYIQNPEMEQIIKELHSANFEIVNTDIPRWKNGVKLKERVDRPVFDMIYALVRKSKGRYNKENDCWIFSSEKKSQEFVNTVHNFSIAKRMADILDIESINYSFENESIKIKLTVPLEECNWRYELEDGCVIIKNDNYFTWREVLDDILLIANKGLGGSWI